MPEIGGFDPRLALHRSVSRDIRAPLFKEEAACAQRVARAITQELEGQSPVRRTHFTPLEGVAGVLPSPAKKLVIKEELAGRSKPPVKISFTEHDSPLQGSTLFHLIQVVDPEKIARWDDMRNFRIASEVIDQILKHGHVSGQPLSAVLHLITQDFDARCQYVQSPIMQSSLEFDKEREGALDRIGGLMTKSDMGTVDDLRIFVDFNAQPRIKQLIDAHPDLFHVPIFANSMDSPTPIPELGYDFPFYVEFSGNMHNVKMMTGQHITRKI